MTLAERIRKECQNMSECDTCTCKYKELCMIFELYEAPAWWSDSFVDRLDCLFKQISEGYNENDIG